MKKLFAFAIMLASIATLSLQAQPQTIAHRGYWQAENSAQNSLTSLVLAQQIGAYGSEFDVWMTADGHIVLNHDGVIDGVRIETANYEDIEHKTLPNGERIPTLEQYLEQGRQNPDVRLVLEIKSHATGERNSEVTAAVVEAVRKADMQNQVDYIAFALNVCIDLARLEPEANIAYLSGDKTPQELKDLNITGLDYNIGVFRRHPEYVEEAHRLGLTINVWTVSAPDDIREMAALGVDFITTDNPVECMEILK